MTKTTAKNSSIIKKKRKPLTREERLAKAARKILSSKKEAEKFLVEIGFLDNNGNVAEIYQ